LEGEPVSGRTTETPRIAARHRGQAGFTLIEVIIATALGLLVMSALTSVVLTTTMAASTITGRVETSAQIRGFQFAAGDDFALARPPAPSGCGTPSSPCTTAIVLLGSLMRNQANDLTPADPFTVRYVWDPTRQVVTRFTEQGTDPPTSRIVARNVTAYSWYVDPSGAHRTVVIALTVTVRGSFGTTYNESETLRFYPRVTATPSP
jgi:prepilin-type N-terminal cleavage/methylation domain-containing protein